MKLRSIAGALKMRLFVLFVGVMLLPACIVVVEKDDDRDDDYYRRRWQLEVIVFSAGTYTPNVGSEYTVVFDAQASLSGRADCMDFEGRYEVGRTSTLSINDLVSPQQACGSDSIAPIYLEELAGARSISGDSDELVIHLKDSGDLMRFKPY